MSYASVKDFLTRHKPQFYLLGAFVLVFFVGVGTGKLSGHTTPSKASSYSNYTTKPSPTPQAKVEAATTEATIPTATPSVTDAVIASPGSPTDCVVKGTASSKIYHVSTGAFYDRLKNPTCFKTEADAVAAGYRKSSR